MKSERGIANVYVIAIVAVIIGAVGGMWYFNVGPFEKGNAEVDVGYILEGGEEVPVEPDGTSSVYGSMNTLEFWQSSSKNTKISGIYGKLNVTPATKNVDPTKSISLTASYKVTAYNPNTSTVEEFASGSASASTVAGTTSSLGKVKISTSSLIKVEKQTVSYSFQYSVTASISGTNLSASDTATGSIDVYYNKPEKTLEISTSIETGHLEIVG